MLRFELEDSIIDKLTIGGREVSGGRKKKTKGEGSYMKRIGGSILSRKTR